MTITKDYGNSCLNNCVLHLFQHKTVAFQDSTIIFLPFPARFSFIITTFATPEPPRATAKWHKEEAWLRGNMRNS